jgi:hypothetical protein
VEVTWARLGHVGAYWSRGLLWGEAGGGKSTSLADSAVGVGRVWGGMRYSDVCLGDAGRG